MTHPRSWFQVCELVSAPTPIPANNRYRVVELFPTMDGLRSRLTPANFATAEEAQLHIDKYLGKRSPE